MTTAAFALKSLATGKLFSRGELMDGFADDSARIFADRAAAEAYLVDRPCLNERMGGAAVVPYTGKVSFALRNTDVSRWLKRSAVCETACGATNVRKYRTRAQADAYLAERSGLRAFVAVELFAG